MRLLGIYALLIFFCCAISAGQAPDSFLIRDVRVFDGEKFLEHRNVFVSSGKISQVTSAITNPQGAPVIDGHGRTLLSGLFDVHVHISEDVDGSLRQTLRLGVTTVLDMFNAGDRLKRIKQIEAEDPPGVSSLRTAGVGATVPGGHPTQMGGPKFPTITNPAEAFAFVDARIAEGSDYIKIIYDDNTQFGESQRMPTLSNETLRALVDASHKRHKLAVAHVLSEQKAREAIAAGIDGLVHMFVGNIAGPDFGQFAASHHVFVAPTLTTLNMICGKAPGEFLLADPHLLPYIDTAFRQMLHVPADPSQNHFCNATDDAMRQLIAARVPILAGTDSPVPGNTYGASLHQELEFLVRAGLAPSQALASATSFPAEIFHLHDRGLIRPGFRADLVLVEGNPAHDILATRSIVDVWKRGVRVQRQDVN